MLSKNKDLRRKLIHLECVECRVNKNSKNIFRYTSEKNRRNTPERLELNKYCPNCKKHTLYKEIK